MQINISVKMSTLCYFPTESPEGKSIKNSLQHSNFTWRIQNIRSFRFGEYFIFVFIYWNGQFVLCIWFRLLLNCCNFSKSTSTFLGAELISIGLAFGLTYTTIQGCWWALITLSFTSSHRSPICSNQNREFWKKKYFRI